MLKVSIWKQVENIMFYKIPNFFSADSCQKFALDGPCIIFENSGKYIYTIFAFQDANLKIRYSQNTVEDIKM